MSQTLSLFLGRCGYVHRRKGRGIMVAGGQSGTSLLRAIVTELRAKYPRENIFSLSAHSGGEQVPADVQLVQPFPCDAMIRTAIARSKAHVLILAPGSGISSRFIEIAQREGICVVMLGLPDAGLAEIDCIGLFFVQEQFEVARLRRMGVDSERIYLIEEGDPSAAAREIIKELEPNIVAERRPGKRLSARRSMAFRFATGPLLRRMYDAKFENIGSLDSLREALGNPSSIMCLGNGPSSEDPRLQEFDCDSIFRVNLQWLGRGYLARPDMIFTGIKSAVREYPCDTVFGFQTQGAEQEMILKCLWVRRKIRYVVAESMGTVDFDSFGVFRPTNGFVMLATAVALNPERLVIAGVDLFQDPAGSYPGDSSTPNAYTLAHDRDTEERAILRLLSTYQGELVIVGDVLREKWSEFRVNFENQCVNPGESIHA